MNTWYFCNKFWYKGCTSKIPFNPHNNLCYLPYFIVRKLRWGGVWEPAWLPRSVSGSYPWIPT